MDFIAMTIAMWLAYVLLTTAINRYFGKIALLSADQLAVILETAIMHCRYFQIEGKPTSSLFILPFLLVTISNIILSLAFFYLSCYQLLNIVLLKNFLDPVLKGYSCDRAIFFRNVASFEIKTNTESFERSITGSVP